LISLAAGLPVHAQNEWEFGPVAGLSYYQGDMNPNRCFYKPGPLLGPMARYVFNPRYAFRADALFGQLRADDLDFNNPYQQARAYSFRTNFVEVSALAEFNFTPFNTFRKNDFDRLTTFVSSGISYLYAFGLESKSYPGIPMIIGGKARLLEGFNLTVAYSYRKLFSDKLDNIDHKEITSSMVMDAGQPADVRQMNDTQHNDWYAMLTVSLSFQVDFNKHKCKLGNEYD
jgi:hypothetical protein